MRKPKQRREYATPPMRRCFRAELTECPTCQTRLRRYATLSQRTVITLHGPLYLTHRGYRCPNAACETRMRSYRSAAADALALPGFTFGLDMVILVGHLRLAQHQTLDEVHQTLCQRLAPFGMTISRREVLYLFDAYALLLRAGAAVTEDTQWREQVQANGGLIISIDGIRPDVGNETIYLVRDVLTARVLVAENVISSETAVIKSLLAPVVSLGLPVLGAISDAQESLVNAIAELWPEVPHQLCQFHYLRDAAEPIYELDRSTRTAMRKDIGRKVHETRKQLARRLQPEPQTPPEAQQREREQLAVLADYALGIQSALNFEGSAPFVYPGIEGYEALSDIESSLQELQKRGPVSVASRGRSWRACKSSSVGAPHGKSRSAPSGACAHGSWQQNTCSRASGRKPRRP
jgi:hypothetical protein